MMLVLIRSNVMRSEPRKVDTDALSTFAVPERTEVLLGPRSRTDTSAKPAKKVSFEARFKRLRLMRPSIAKLFIPFSPRAIVPLMVIFDPPPENFARLIAISFGLNLID